MSHLPSLVTYVLQHLFSFNEFSFFLSDLNTDPNVFMVPPPLVTRCVPSPLSETHLRLLLFWTAKFLPFPSTKFFSCLRPKYLVLLTVGPLLNWSKKPLNWLPMLEFNMDTRTNPKTKWPFQAKWSKPKNKSHPSHNLPSIFFVLKKKNLVILNENF